MPQKWIKEVSIQDLKPETAYILANKHATPWGFSYSFYARWLNGKTGWSEKPGISMRFSGDEKLIKFLTDQTFCVALEVPADADRRWKARKHRFTWQKK